MLFALGEITVRATRSYTRRCGDRAALQAVAERWFRSHSEVHRQVLQLHTFAVANAELQGDVHTSGTIDFTSLSCCVTRPRDRISKTTDLHSCRALALWSPAQGPLDLGNALLATLPLLTLARVLFLPRLPSLKITVVGHSKVVPRVQTNSLAY